MNAPQSRPGPVAAAMLLGAFPVLARILAGQAVTPAPAAPATTAIVASRPPYRIVVDELSGTHEVRSSKGEVMQTWSATALAGGRAVLARIPAGAPVEVELVNANPLLYRYDMQTSVVARRPLPSCRSLGSRLALGGALTGFATVATAAQPMLLPVVSPMFQPPPEPPEATTRGTAQPTAEEQQAALRLHGEAVQRYARFLAGVRSLALSLPDSIAALAELAESQPLDSLVGGLQRSIEAGYPGLSQAARVPIALREEASRAEPHLAALRQVDLALARGADAPSAAGSEITRLVAEVDATQKDLAASYRGLQTQLVRLESARAGSHQRFSTDASADVRRLTVTADPSPDWPGLIRVRAGRRELYTEPSVSLLCQLSLGVGFMDRPPEYGVEGGNVVNRASSQRTGITVMLHLAMPRFPLLAALAGIGFGSGDMPDLYAGGSLRLLDPLLLNAGVVWQRTQQLPPGYAEGQPAQDPTRLVSLKRSYEAGFFWGVSLAR